MTGTDYKEILEKAKTDLIAAQQEMGNCLKKQDELEKRISGLRQTIVALSRMLDEEFVEEDALGLTDAIREAYKSFGGPMVPTDVKGRLEFMGYDISKYGNVMASIHSIINRLAARGDIISTGTVGGKPAHAWNKDKLSPVQAYTNLLIEHDEKSKKK